MQSATSFLKAATSAPHKERSIAKASKSISARLSAISLAMMLAGFSTNALAVGKLLKGKFVITAASNPLRARL